MGNSQSFDDDATYGKDSLFAETEDSSMIVRESEDNVHPFNKRKKNSAISQSPSALAAPQNRMQTNYYGRTNINNTQRNEQIAEKGRDWSPDDLSDRDELSAMTDMAWKHLSSRIRSQSNTVEPINADEEYSLRQSRDDDGVYDGRKSDNVFRSMSPTAPPPLRIQPYSKSATEPSNSSKVKNNHQSESWSKRSEQDKYSIRTYSAEESYTRYSKDTMVERPPSPESFFGFGGMWGNDSPPSTKSDLSPVYSPRSPVSPSSPRRNEDKNDISTRMEYITSRLDAMTESQISNSIQAEKIWEQETIQESLHSSLEAPQQRGEEWNLDDIYARLDELSKNQLVGGEPVGSLTEATFQETIIHDDEIQIESDGVIEVQQIDRNVALSQSETAEIESRPSLIAQTKSKDRTLIVETTIASSEAQCHGALVPNTSFKTTRVSPIPENDFAIKMESDKINSAKDDTTIPPNTAVAVLAHPRIHADSADLLITEDFLDKCGNFVTSLVENPLTSPCDPAINHDRDHKTIADQDEHGKSSQCIDHTATDNIRLNDAADALEASPKNTIAQVEFREEQATSDTQSTISDALDIEFVKKYANLFEAFLTENIDLMDQNPDMISFLYVAKLTKIMEASEKLESAFKKRIAKLRSDKDSVLSLYREDLIKAAKEKVVKGIQHEQDLKILQESGRVMEGKLKWKLLMENASRARHEAILVQTLWKTTMDAETPLEYLPAGLETQVIRQAAVAGPIELPESHDVLLKDLRRFQMENNFLNTEISVLESKLNQRKHTANTHLWVDSVFRRLGSKPKKA